MTITTNGHVQRQSRGKVTGRDPRPSGPELHGATPIIGREQHDQWCRWPYQTRDANRPDLAHCAGCARYVRIIG